VDRPSAQRRAQVFVHLDSPYQAGSRTVNTQVDDNQLADIHEDGPVLHVLCLGPALSQDDSRLAVTLRQYLSCRVDAAGKFARGWSRSLGAGSTVRDGRPQAAIGV